MTFFFIKFASWHGKERRSAAQEKEHRHPQGSREQSEIRNISSKGNQRGKAICIRLTKLLLVESQCWNTDFPQGDPFLVIRAK